MAWLATPLARSRLVVPLNLECPEQPLLYSLPLLPLPPRPRRPRRSIYGQLMKRRQSPGAQKARQTCCFNLTSSFTSHAQSKSTLQCFLLIVCVNVCVCAYACVCTCDKSTYKSACISPDHLHQALHSTLLHGTGWLEGGLNGCLCKVLPTCVQCELNI